MNPALQQFVSVALPNMVTLVAMMWIAQRTQNKRVDDLHRSIEAMRDDMNRRFDEVNQRLERIEVQA